ncbi:heavy metal translocating P-type ATPase [Rugamonas sp. FT107W]|uniref:P-type Zn(2+) transporter n=1 Tax=Duganella vulcania TaxID=2692166 RepID=A0A845HLP8_9BURK|nr:cation-translocating P-type ATPase [Duganella vulcania]MYN19668.1 heavy metal translocating P-type ATPase [Duganella vulcania]
MTMKNEPCCSGDDACASGAPAAPIQPGPGVSSTVYHIENMDCAVEERLIRNKLEGMSGVVDLEFNFIARKLTVHQDVENRAAIEQALRSIGMPTTLVAQGEPGSRAKGPSAALSLRQKALLAVSGICAVLAEVAAWTSGTDTSPWIAGLAAVSMVAAGLPTLKKGWIALKTLTLNINFLMCVAVGGALVLGQWPEAAMVTFLFAVAELIESLALNRARNSVNKLMRLAPEVALVWTAGGWTEVGVKAVNVGDLLRVRPGERIALDGRVTAGYSSVNQAPITGESMPVAKVVGDTVYAGTINENGVLEIQVSASNDDSVLAKIIRVIDETQGNQAPTQRFVDHFARYYTPVVVGLAIVVAVLPPVAFGVPFSVWLYKALVMLVIACPCALVLSTPVTIVSGLTAAARAGILIKGGQFLEMGHQLKVIAVDKTGTLTEGRPQVTSVSAQGKHAKDDVLILAASLDANSTHPLAMAIMRARPVATELKSVSKFESLPGLGVKGEIEKCVYFLGNARLMAEAGIPLPHEATAGLGDTDTACTMVFLALQAEVVGVIYIADVVRPGAAAAIKELNDIGVRTVMLTGDNAAIATSTAAQVGIQQVQAELLPEHKLDAIRILQAGYGAVGMVGDGINDAPALAQAEVGFAMGAAGSDTAIETADVALMDDDLHKIAGFIRLSRRTRAILVQNIATALGIKLVFFGLAVAGFATLWMAVFADVGASLLVVANGLRLLRRKSSL